MTTGGSTVSPQGTDALLARYAGALIPVFGTPQLVLTHGKGCVVTDADGRDYLDLLAGIAVNTLGHGHPALAGALAAAADLVHVSNFFTTPAQVSLAERLIDLAEAPAGSGVFFTNSGTEAIEAAVKLSRRTGRRTIIAAERAFHGRSTGALALTHKEAYREPFAPLLERVVFVPFDDPDALRGAVTDVGDDLAAVVLEPIQGEAGVHEASADYLRLARELTTAGGALLVFDEIQSGMGRTGDWFAHQFSGVQPDALTMAKGLAGGVPIGALLTFGPAVTGLLTAGQHGSTFGGNPLACGAALAVIDTVEREGLRDNAIARGEQLAALSHPAVVEVRGRGLLRAVELADELAPAFVTAARAAGFIVNATGPTTVRLTPPLVIGAAEIASFVDAFPSILDAARVANGAA